jgi:hypothetical protein
MSAELWNSAVSVLDANWAGDHMVPSRRLYPHQWSWDAAFIAVGLAYTNPTRAWRDLRHLFEAQWPDGRVPHIVFNPSTAEDDYFPGPAFWAVPAYDARPARGSTALVQPPLHALGAWEVYRHATAHGAGCAQDAGVELAWLYPRLVRQQEYLLGRRDAGGDGLASIVHPWESGLDNSPSWDATLAAVPVDLGLLQRHKRRDLEGADAAHRPTDVDYARYLGLALNYRAGPLCERSAPADAPRTARRAGGRDHGRGRHPISTRCVTGAGRSGSTSTGSCAGACCCTATGARPRICERRWCG